MVGTEIIVKLEDSLNLDKIKLVNNELWRINNNLKLNQDLIDEYFNKTQPHSVNLKKVKVDGGKPENCFDTYMINIDEIYDETHKLKSLKKIYEEYLDNEYKRIVDLKEKNMLKELIVYLADEINKNFIEIADIVGYGIRHTYRLYKETKDVIDMSQKD